jgi:hypothetical protein
MNRESAKIGELRCWLVLDVERYSRTCHTISHKILTCVETCWFCNCWDTTSSTCCTLNQTDRNTRTWAQSCNFQGHVNIHEINLAANFIVSLKFLVKYGKGKFMANDESEGRNLLEIISSSARLQSSDCFASLFKPRLLPSPYARLRTLSVRRG